MKKLAYIILVIAILLLIAYFVKNEQSIAQEPENQAEVLIETNVAATPSTEAPSTEAPSTEAPLAAPSEDSDVVNVQETTEDIIIEEDTPEDDGAIDVEETSEATTDEEETILPE